MRFSIIVPVYNVEKYLRRCLDSIVGQTFQDYEAILVDDGSVDQSGKICDEYNRTSKHIRVIHQENQGLSGARNTGLSAVCGDWILFVDSDDWIETDTLQTLDAYMKKTKADLYSFNARKVHEDDCHEAKKLLFMVENETISFINEEEKFQFFFHELMQYKIGWEVWMKVYKRSIIQKNHLRFVSTKKVFAEDYLFTFQYMLYVNKIVLLCNIFYNYFQREGSLLHSTVKESILPKLYWIGEIGYRTVCRERMRYFRKYYHKLYFMILDHHIQYSLQKLPNEVLERNLAKMSKHRLHCKWMKQIKKERNSYLEYMEIRTWL